MTSTSHGTNLRLADIVTAFRNIHECYRNIRTMGSDGFTVASSNISSAVQTNNLETVQNNENLPENLNISSSSGSILLQTILTYWYSINENMKAIDTNQDLTLLRPYTIQMYNESRSIQSLIPPHDIASHILLLRGRQYACSLLCLITSVAHTVASSPIPEATRCWFRTALAWESLYNAVPSSTDSVTTVQEYLLNQVKQSYRSAIQYHDAGGGTAVLSRLLIGIELETHMQVIFDSIVGYSRILWKDSTETVPNNIKTELQRLLLHDAVLLIPYLSHERFPLVKIMMDMGQSFIDHRKYIDAEVWLQATLKLMDTMDTRNTKVSNVSSTYEYDTVKNHLLLSLATCIIEQVTDAKMEGRLTEYNDSNVSSNTVSLQSSVGKITGYLAAARGEKTVIGQHLLVQVACLQNRIDDALKHLHELIELSSKFDSGSISRVPLFRSVNLTPDSSANILVSPNFHLITSALRSIAILRNFDLIAMKEYGNVATTCFSQTSEIGLLRHDLLVSLLVSLSNGKINEGSGTSPLFLSSSPSSASLQPYKALQDPRVEWTLNRIIEDNGNGTCPVTVFVRESILKILQDGIQSAYEAKEWTVCLSFLERLFSFVTNNSAGSPIFSPERFSHYYRVKANALFELQKHTDALEAVNEALRHYRSIVSLFLRLRIVSKISNASTTVSSVNRSNVQQVFQELTSAPDFLPIHLLAAVQELIEHSDTGNICIDNDDRTISTFHIEKLRIAETAIDNLFRSVPDYDVSKHHSTLRTIGLVRLAMDINQRIHRNDRFSEATIPTMLQLLHIVAERIRTCERTKTQTNEYLGLLHATTGNVTDFVWCIYSVWNVAMASWTKKNYYLSAIAAGMLSQFARTVHEMVHHDTNGTNVDGYSPEYRNLYQALRIIGTLLGALNHYAIVYSGLTTASFPVPTDTYASLYTVCGYTPSVHLRYAQQYLNDIKKDYTEGSMVNSHNTFTLHLWKLVQAFLSTVDDHLGIDSPVSFSEAWGNIPLIVAVTDIQVRLLADPGIASTPSVSLFSSLIKLNGNNSFVFDKLSDLFRQSPYSHRTLAYQALLIGKDKALTVFRSKVMNKTNHISIQYIASTYRKLVLLASSRSESLPIFDEILQFLSGTADVSFPTDELDYLGVLAWNHGCYFYRMNVLERAERFMNWTIHIIPYLATTNRSNMIVTGTDTDSLINSTMVCLSNAKAMQKQYDHLCQLLGKQTKISIPVPVVLDNLTNTASSILNRVSSIVNESVMEPLVVSSTVPMSSPSDEIETVHEILPLEPLSPTEGEGRKKRPYSPSGSHEEKSGLTPTGKKRSMDTHAIMTNGSSPTTTSSNNTNYTVLRSTDKTVPLMTISTASNTSSTNHVSSSDSTLLMSDPLDDKDESFNELCRLDNDLATNDNENIYGSSTTVTEMDSI